MLSVSRILLQSFYISPKIYRFCVLCPHNSLQTSEMFLLRQLPAAAEKIWVMWNDGVATLFRPLQSGNPLRPPKFFDHQHQFIENTGNFLSPAVFIN